MSQLKTYAEDLESVSFIYTNPKMRISIFNFFNLFHQDAFNPEEYVERLAWRLTGAGENPLDASHLHTAFEEEIANLQILSDHCQTKITHFQNQCREEEEEYYVALERLQAENAVKWLHFLPYVSILFCNT